MSIGRPTKYKKKFGQDLVDHLKTGGNVESFGAYLAEKYRDASLLVCKDTVYEWIKKHKAFADAKGLAEAASHKFWLEIGRVGMTGQLRRVSKESPLVIDGKVQYDREGKVIMTKEYEPASFGQAAWIFMMKNRFRWRDRTELTGPGDKPVSLSDLARLAEAELAKGKP